MKRNQILTAIVCTAIISLSACAVSPDSSAIDNINGTQKAEIGTKALVTVLPAHIEAEAYTVASGVSIGSSANASTSRYQYIGWIDQGDWIDYDIFVPADGEYSFEFRLAANSDFGQFDVQINNATIRRNDSTKYWGIARIDVKNTYGWENWYTETMKANLTKGTQRLRIWAGGKLFNIDYIKITGQKAITSVFTLPAQVEPELFVTNSGMGYALQSYVAADGTAYVSMNFYSKFGTSNLEFTVISPTDRTYTFEYRIASFYTPQLKLSIDDVQYSITDLKSTGAYDANWVVIPSTVTLSAGTHKVNIQAYGTSPISGAPFSLDYIKIY